MRFLPTRRRGIEDASVGDETVYTQAIVSRGYVAANRHHRGRAVNSLVWPCPLSFGGRDYFSSTGSTRSAEALHQVPSPRRGSTNVFAHIQGCKTMGEGDPRSRAD